MKKIVPWMYLAMTPVWALDASQEGIQAYREGRYLEALPKLIQSAHHDPVAEYYLGRMRLYGYGVPTQRAQALENIRHSATQGYLPAVLWMARFTLNVNHDAKEALTWFKKAADLHDLASERYCMAAYRFGWGTQPNFDLEERYAIAAAKQGDLLAQYTLAHLFLNQRSLTTQRAGFAWLEKVGRRGYPQALFELSEWYAKDSKLVKKNEATRAMWLAEAQSKGYDPSHVSAIPSGDQPVDEKMALWLTEGKSKTLAESGYGFSSILTTWHNQHALKDHQYHPSPLLEHQTQVAIYQPHFKMIDPNEVPLFEIFSAYMQSQPKPSTTYDFPSLALVMPEVTDHLIAKAILGDSTAQFALGQLYERGVSVPKNIEKAVEYYSKSAAQFDLRAEYQLGLLYLTGDKPDYPQAVGWLTDAAFKGSADAEYVLGQLFSQGYRDASGVEVIAPDHDQALAMYDLGAANGSAKASYQLALLWSKEPTQHLTVSQKKSRCDLLASLYQYASTQGLEDAVMPAAFFKVMQGDTKTQQAVWNMAYERADKDPMAALLVGLMYDRGMGVDPSYAKAMKFYGKAGQRPVVDFLIGTHLAMASHDFEDAALKLSRASSFSYAVFNLAMVRHAQQKAFLPLLEQARVLGLPQASLLLADDAFSKQDQNAWTAGRRIYLDIAEKGDPEGALKLGYAYEQGLGGSVDLTQALYWYQKSAESKQPMAQYRLGRLYDMGQAVAIPDYALAKYWYTASMDQGYAPAAVALGFLHDTVFDDYDHAKIAYQEAAKQNDAVGLFNLGVLYALGKGQPVQMNEAKAVYLEAASKDNVEAMVQLGDLYRRGAWGRVDEDEARRWYEKAALKQDKNALYQLGSLAFKDKRLDEALKYYQKASSLGQPEAMLALANMYRSGSGVPKNDMEAAVLYEKLSSMGNAFAAYELGMMMDAGLLGEERRKEAQAWLKRSADEGYQAAVQKISYQQSQADTRISFMVSLENS